MKDLLPVLYFVVRHALAQVLGVLVGCVVWTVVYLLLLAYATVGNEGLGGPLAYPAGIVTILGAAVAVGMGVFVPSCGVGAAFCGVLRLPRLAAIPIVFAAAFALSYLIYWVFIESLTTHSMPALWVVFRNFTIYLSVPLGIYWWLTEGPGALVDGVRRWLWG